MLIGNLFGLLGLLAIPAILAIHLFRRTYKQHDVSALWLYGPGVMVAAAGRRPEKLRNRRSMWFELLAALILTAWLSDLHWTDRQQAVHHIWILDDRRSLQAIGPDGESTADRLRDALTHLAGRYDRDDRLTIIASGSPPRLLAGPAERPDRAVAVLKDWQPAAPWHDLQEARELAADLLRHGDEDKRAGRVTIASDRVTAAPAGRTGLLAVGLPVGNQALVDARWFADGDGEHLSVRVANFSEAPVTRTCAVVVAGESRVEAAVTVAAGESELVRLALPTPIPDEVTVRLNGSDPLAADDVCVLERPPFRHVDVGMGLAEDHPLRAALEPVLAIGPARPVDEEGALLITTEDAPVAAGCWRVRISAGDDADDSAVLGPFLARRGLPLVADCDFTGCLWAGGVPLSSVPADEVALAAGERCLIRLRRRGRAFDIDLYLDPTRSSVLRHPSWPALWYNLLHWRRDHLPGVRRRNLPAGQPNVVMLPPAVPSLTLTPPGDDGVPVELIGDGDGRVVIPGLAQPGGWQIDLPGRPAWDRIRVLPVDPRSGDCRTAGSGGREAVGSGTSAVERQRDLFDHVLPLLLMAGMVVASLAAFGREQGDRGASS